MQIEITITFCKVSGKTLNFPENYPAVSNSKPNKDFALKREQIPVNLFKTLWEELQRVLREEYNLILDSTSRNSARFFGMGDFAPYSMPDRTTVASVIVNHPEVKAFLEEFPEESSKINFGDYLYKRLRGISNKPNEQSVTFGKRAYVYGYFLFLGFPNMEAFAASIKEPDPLPVEPASSKMLPSHYLGSFYSVRSYAIKHFVIKIDFSNPLGENVFPAEEWGFHRLEDVSGHASPAIEAQAQQPYSLEGVALIRNNKLYLNLVTPDSQQNWTQMNIMGWGFGVHPDLIKVQHIIRCNIQTVSVLGYPVAAEAVLVRIHESKWAETKLKERQVPTSPVIRTLLGEVETDTLMLYLMLQRRNFWIKNEYVENLLDLQVRGNLMQNFRYLRGRWRVWNYGLKRGHVIQSKLIINEHFASTFCPYLKSDILESNPRLKNQAATLSISRGIQPNKLFFHTYLKPNLTIINTAIFDLETFRELGFAEGMFLSGGYDYQGIIGGYCVMKKLQPGEEDFEPMEFTREEALAYEEKHNVQGLYEGLRSLWRSKTWRRRKINDGQLLESTQP